MGAVQWHTLGMSEGFDIAALRRRLAQIMERQDIKPTTLSLKIGKSPTLVKDLLEKTDDTKVSTIFRLAKALGVDAADLLSDEVEAVPAGPTIYLRGEVAAGQWLEADEWDHDDWQAVMGRPDIRWDAKYRYALRVCGDSMDQLYPEGTLIECVSTMSGIEPKPGQKVVVVRRRRDQLLEATVKEMVEIDNEIWFVPRSSNPVHRAFRASDADDDVIDVRVAAVVVSSVRPE